MQKKYLNLRGISEILSEKEMRNVVGASSGTGSLFETVFTACADRQTCGGTCFAGVYQGSCGMWFPYMDKLEWYCVCIASSN